MDSVFQFFSLVFQFFSFLVFQFPELFRNISRETEKLNFPGTFRQRFSIWIQFFSFSVSGTSFSVSGTISFFSFSSFYFRNISRETEKLRQRIWIQFFSFSVSGTKETEKLKN